MKRIVLLAICIVAAMQAQAQYMPGPSTATPSYQGLWWNSPAGSQSGWGINIAHQGRILFATWFTYDEDGSGMWLVVPDAEQVGTAGASPYGGTMTESMPTYTGAIYRTTGPAFDAQPFDPAKVGAQVLGIASFQFLDASDGTFTSTIGGAVQMHAITRQVFGPMPDCSLGGSPGSTPNFSDLWWRSPAGSESGWGVNLTQQGDTLFATWFTYDDSGKGLWLVMSNGVRTGPQSWSGTLYRTRGPAFDGTWDGSKVAASAEGTASFAFTDANDGTFTATVDGHTVSEPITRQVYSTPSTICR